MREALFLALLHLRPVVLPLLLAIPLLEVGLSTLPAEEAEVELADGCIG